ncbi:unnamed protein product [Polarella glacialis]|uniref:Protein tweety homolog n=1 Tax=Polarella glacialis TaxID=89957 RepID=A0A813E6J3_POLGL|nr:unnamed protein product [Polarella glacialis]CAE8711959.1 unnamed protein product [Polarella glacialis]
MGLQSTFSVNESSNWVDNATAGFAVQVLQCVNSQAIWPGPSASASVWYHFVWSIVTVPGILLATGILLAVFEPHLRWCCRPRKKTPGTTQASRLRLLVAIVFSLFVLGAGVSLAAQQARDSYNLTVGEMERVISDIDTADKLVQSLSKSGGQALPQIGLLVQTCPATYQAYLLEVVKGPRKTGGRYLQLVDEYARIIKKLPALAQALKSYLQYGGRGLLAFLAVPLGLLAFSFSVICVLALSAGCRRRSRESRTARCCLALLPLVILVVTAFAACGFAMANTVASFCVVSSSSNSGVSSYAGHAFGYESPEFNYSRYYVRGQGDNAALDALAAGQGALDELEGNMQEYKRDMAEICSGWNHADEVLDADLQSIRQSLGAFQELLSPRNIHPYFSKTVHANLCGSALSTLCLTVLSEILAIICLPFVVAAFTSHSRHLAREVLPISEAQVMPHSPGCDRHSPKAVGPILLGSRRRQDAFHEAREPKISFSRRSGDPQVFDSVLPFSHSDCPRVKEFGMDKE